VCFIYTFERTYGLVMSYSIFCANNISISIHVHVISCRAPKRKMKVQDEVVAEEESTLVSTDQVEEPSNWYFIGGSSTSSLQQRQDPMYLPLPCIVKRLLYTLSLVKYALSL
jgi:hypothetical protein